MATALAERLFYNNIAVAALDRLHAVHQGVHTRIKGTGYAVRCGSFRHNELVVHGEVAVHAKFELAAHVGENAREHSAPVPEKGAPPIL